MKARPLMFTAPMVRALLAGTKTQTRRVVKFPVLGPDLGGKRRIYIPTHDSWAKELPAIAKFCPHGRVGDRLWVRETYCPVSGDPDDKQHGGKNWVDYRATPWDDESAPAGWHNTPDDVDALKWCSPMMMPRRFSRIELEITEVRIQQVQSITNDDARAEGISADNVVDFAGDLEANRPGAFRAGFEQAWRRMHGKEKHHGDRAWNANPWVWAISFKRVKP